MTDNRGTLLKKLGLEPPAPPSPAPPGADRDEDECPAFGYLRSPRERALHVEFRLATGNAVAFPYSWLGPATYDPSRGVTLFFVGDRTYRVEIAGRNLDAVVGGAVTLFDRGLLRHRVTWVRELDPADARRLPDAALAVERIAVRVVEAVADLYDPGR